MNNSSTPSRSISAASAYQVPPKSIGSKSSLFDKKGSKNKRPVDTGHHSSGLAYHFDICGLDLFLGSQTRRLWVVFVIEINSGVVVGYQLLDHLPNQLTFVAVLWLAMLCTPEHPVGGVPDELYLASGKDCPTEYAKKLGKLGVQRISNLRNPQHISYGERFWRAVKEQFVLHLPTSGAFTTQLTLAELSDQFGEWLRIYHCHASLAKAAPMELWPVPGVRQYPSGLDAAVIQQLTCMVSKTGIVHANQIYVFSGYSRLIGKAVTVLISTGGVSPTLEVFHKNQWVATAQLSPITDFATKR